MKIIKEQQSNFLKIQKFYSTVEYYSEIQPNDIVFSAYEEDEIIGVVRIALENNVLVLRGMMIASSHQRQGVGTLLIKELEKSIGDHDCYCIPHDWLEGFYGQIGFFKIEDKKSPKHLQERIVENRKKYPHLIMMKRPAQI